MRYGRQLIVAAVLVSAGPGFATVARATVQASVAPQYTVVDLGSLGVPGDASEQIYINDQGQVAGSIPYQSGAYLVTHSFLWTAASGMVDLGLPQGWDGVPMTVIATGLNNSGEVTGTVSSSVVPTALTAFTWTAAGGMQWLGGLAFGDTAEPIAINDGGEIVGNNTKPDGTEHAVAWSPGNVVTDLGALAGSGGSFAVAVSDTGQVIGDSGLDVFSWTPGGGMVDVGNLGGGSAEATTVADNGDVVGWGYLSGFPTREHAFVWTAGSAMTDLGTLGGNNSQPFGANGNGQVVGWSTTSTGASHAFSWTSTGGMVDLGTLGGTTSWAKAVNDSGQVVGYSTTASGAEHAFVWTAETGMVDLGNLPGDNSQALGINAAGQIVGLSYAAGSFGGAGIPTLWQPQTPTGGGGAGGSGGGGGGGGGGAPGVGGAAAVQRAAGGDRIGTAVAISQNSFAYNGASAVVLATALDYPDALVGAPLAASKNAPLLLTEGATLPPATQQELTRVLGAGGTVYLLGGESAIPDSVSKQLENAGYDVVRLAGSDRFTTAVAVAGVLGNPSTTFLASGAAFADALAAGPAAAHLGGAVLLTNGAAMPPATATYLAAHAGPVYAVGGPAATADSAAVPVFGADRYATAAAVASKFFAAPATAGVATGSAFPDALAGAAELGRTDGPLLLATVTTVPQATRAYLADQGATITRVDVFGGAAALDDDVVTQIRSALTATS
jgi:probable HAF family extracellular repeat protein